ncbi:unnamed protein product [Nesidiocoris tenuis]|uniref:Uncharacterized protein n=1 Tax=Nesidiocoris tenuis TaxID=355587 RepID=A0A6H5GNH8_9HEMI|nr:unnamed protein product [Nesidiocoris tenuis]
MSFDLALIAGNIRRFRRVCEHIQSQICSRRPPSSPRASRKFTNELSESSSCGSDTSERLSPYPGTRVSHSANHNPYSSSPDQRVCSIRAVLDVSGPVTTDAKQIQAMPLRDAQSTGARSRSPLSYRHHERCSSTDATFMREMFTSQGSSSEEAGGPANATVDSGEVEETPIQRV